MISLVMLGEDLGFGFGFEFGVLREGVARWERGFGRSGFEGCEGRDGVEMIAKSVAGVSMSRGSDDGGSEGGLVGFNGVRKGDLNGL